MKTFDEIKWFQQVPFGDGHVTPGRSPCASLENLYQFSMLDFKDKTVLDIGANDGYFSFAAEDRGASEVTAVELSATDGFEWLHNVKKSGVKLFKRSILNFHPGKRFDIVLCFGVHYHVTDPLTLLCKAFSLSNRDVLFEGEAFDAEEPLLKLLPPGYYNDATNIFTITTPFISRLGEMHGFFLRNVLNVSLDRKSWHFVRHTDSPQVKYSIINC